MTTDKCWRNWESDEHYLTGWDNQLIGLSVDVDAPKKLECLQAHKAGWNASRVTQIIQEDRNSNIMIYVCGIDGYCGKPLCEICRDRPLGTLAPSGKFWHSSI